ncbi:MAG: YbaY family lipoprotein [Candidatus Promineifilaceae bacterium]|jgi:uncharacterized lipoprotein YbaY
MNSKSLKRIVQTMKSSRVRYAMIFASLVLILVFSAVQASGPMRPPQPPTMPPQNNCGWGMQNPSWGMGNMPSWGMQYCRPWYPQSWYWQGPVPKIYIYMVVADDGVVITTEDFPEDENFTVTMGQMYTRGVDGIVVGSFNSGDGSSQTLGFNIPAELQGENRIAIRAQSDHEYFPYYAFNWFFNNDYTPTDVNEALGTGSASDMLATAVQSTESGVPLAAAAESNSEETTAVEETTETAPAEPEIEVGTGGAAELTDVVWNWTEFTDPVQGPMAIDAPEQYTVEFAPEGLVFVKADCNNGSGTYITDEDGSIDIAIGIVTLAACDPESLSDQFLQYLGEAALYSYTEEGALLLDLPADAGTMTFAAGDAVAVTEGEEAASTEETEVTVTVTGTVTYMERIALPDDAVVNVQLQDTSLADAPAVVLGEQTIETAGEQVPIPFEISYNPDDIVEGNTYVVRATINDGDGNLLFTSDTVIPVITNDNPTEDVEIVTVSAASGEEVEAPAEEETETGEPALTGVVWSWTEFTDPVQGILSIEDPSVYTVTFLEDGSVAIKADCNNGSGSYVADEDGAIDITVGAVTLALCADDSLSDQFIQYLDAAAIYFFDNGDMLMDLPVDSGTLRFAAGDAEASATAKLASVALMPAAGGGGEDEQDEDTSTVPSFTICVVERNETVSIVGENFPADQTFAVKMGVAQTYTPMPSRPTPYQNQMNSSMGMQSMGQPMRPGQLRPGQPMGQPMGRPGGMWMDQAPKIWIPYYEAGTLETGEGGDVAATFDIPAELAGAYKISILMRTDHQFPYISYNWFYNNDADVCNGEVTED